MNLLALTFANPWLLSALITLPLIYLLLRLTPPRAHKEPFAPMIFLQRLKTKEEEAHHSPWWLIILRLLLAACIILGLAAPHYQPSPQKFDGEKSILIVVDDRWSSAVDWERRKINVENWLQHAQDNARGVALVKTSEGIKADFSLQRASEVLNTFATSQPKASNNNIDGFLEKLEGQKQNGYFDTFDTWVWVNDGLETQDNTKLAQALQNLEIENSIIYMSENLKLTKIENVRHRQENLEVSIARLPQDNASSGYIVAYDKTGRVLAQQEFIFAAEENQIQINFEQPIELRNEFYQLKLQGNGNNNVKHAGAVYLLDTGHKRRKVALASGETNEDTQPLLSPLYFLSRALQPFAQIQEVDIGKVQEFNDIINSGISTLIVADIGTFSQSVEETISEWVENGGMLVRFAGPRLAASEQQSLIPVQLRRGSRNLSSTLSWSTPQHLAPFAEKSPFAGIVVPEDVTVTKQVLAEPAIDLEQNIWARLQDGTPLVTAKQQNDGWVVLFHMSAGPDWSSLPLSGAFVEMLRRIVALSYAVTPQNNFNENNENNDESTSVLVPLSVLDGFGVLTPPSVETRPLAVDNAGNPKPSIDNIAGFYGQDESLVALNLFQNKNNENEFVQFKNSNVKENWEIRNLEIEQPIRFKTPLLILAFVLFLVDCIAVLSMAGVLQIRSVMAKASITIFAFVILSVSDSIAQEQNNIDFTASLETRMGYVLTGNNELDEISRKGLLGLTRFISTRTALEPAEPDGVDISKDELAFYPLLYWPITPNQSVPDTKTMERVNTFMKQGGTVLFDTQDYRAGSVWGEDGISAATLKLREILSFLDIPPIEPVPANHVLTRSFYLLSTFYGRFRGSPLWVETLAVEDTSQGRQSDGVSSVLITAGDFAGAWAVEPSGAYTLPISPPNPRQRTLAYRAGVNIIMYTLTGNYKSDQVHTPALLKRLGQ